MLKYINMQRKDWALFSSHKASTHHYLQKKTYIFMIHTLHEDQLPVSSFGMRLVLKWSAELLNGHISVKDGIISSAVVITNTGCVCVLEEILQL